MVSEEYCVVLLLASSDQEEALIKKHLTAVDNAIEVCVENTSSAILGYLKKSAQASSSEAYLRPRLILLSIRELSADVVEILEYLQDSSDIARTPVLIFSESVAPDEIQKAYKLKVNSYLRKPQTLDDFAGMLKEVAEYWLKWNQLPS